MTVENAAARQTAPQTGYVQLLSPEGERVSYPGYEDVSFSPDQLRGFYQDMVLVRRIDTEGTALARQGELAIWASLLGQEASQVGSGRALTDDDFVFPTYREHGVAYCRGIEPVQMLGLFRGVDHAADGLAASLRKRCIELPDPDPERMFRWVYEESSPEVELQREQYAEYLSGFEEARV